MDYDAVLLVSFGGPERPDDVLPFMQNVTRGRNIPPERLAAVSEHYHLFGGRSPINDHSRALKVALEAEFATHGPPLPVYWGNRNWEPYLADAIRRMRDDGIERALCFVTSAYSSYPGCRQYREDLARARSEVGEGAPRLDKLRVFYNHPGFLEPQVDAISAALEGLPADTRADTAVVFVTHSLPLTMARHCDYEAQHLEACRIVMTGFPGRAWDLVYCSRSGHPEVPWLEPDVNDHLEVLADRGHSGVVMAPIGFVADHMEVVYDLDVEAMATARRLGLPAVRTGTVGTHPRFVSAIRELIAERHAASPRRALGVRGASHDDCPVDCCLTPGQEVRPVVAEAAPPATRGTASH